MVWSWSNLSSKEKLLVFLCWGLDALGAGVKPVCMTMSDYQKYLSDSVIFTYLASSEQCLYRF